MLKTQWRKPVTDYGGISRLISDAVMNRDYFDSEYHINIVVHAYREVAYTLEAAIEIQFWEHEFEVANPKCIVKFRNVVL